MGSGRVAAAIPPRSSPAARAAAVAALILSLGDAAGAQSPTDPPPKFDATVAAGIGQIVSDEVSHGAGPSVGGRFAARLWPHVWIGVDADYLSVQRDSGDVRWTSQAFLLNGGVAYFFRSSGTQPFIEGLVGGSRIHRMSRAPSSIQTSGPGGLSRGPEQIFESVTTAATFGARAGAVRAVTRSFIVAADARVLVVSGNVRARPIVQSRVVSQARLSVGYRWAGGAPGTTAPTAPPPTPPGTKAAAAAAPAGSRPDRYPRFELAPGLTLASTQSEGMVGVNLWVSANIRERFAIEAGAASAPISFSETYGTYVIQGRYAFRRSAGARPTTFFLTFGTLGVFERYARGNDVVLDDKSIIRWRPYSKLSRPNGGVIGLGIHRVVTPRVAVRGDLQFGVGLDNDFFFGFRTSGGVVLPIGSYPPHRDAGGGAP